MAAPQAKKGFLRLRVSHALVIALVFGSIGAYLLFGAQASDSENLFNVDGHISGRNFLPEADGTIKVVVSGTIENRSRTNTYQANFVFFSDQQRVEYVKHTCHPRLSCVNSDWTGYPNYSSEHMDAKVTDLRLCATAPPRFSIGYPHTFITVTYRVKDASRPFWFEISQGEGPGSCRENASAKGVRYDGGYGGCFNILPGSGAGCYGTGGFGQGRKLGKNPGPGKTGKIKGDDGSGDGKSSGQGTGSGNSNSSGSSGGGGGGSAANQQDDQPNPLPSNSDQGEADKQPEVEPSPFFDGKLFAAGSDAETGDINGVSIAGQKFGYGWVYLTGAVLILGIGGILGWRWWRSLNPIAKANFKARLKR